MPIIKHKFLHLPPEQDTEILIIGTFNPDTEGNPAEFFYGRRQNYLWRLLPFSFGENDLKGKSVEEKTDFILRHKIHFTDLIEEVEVEDGHETNYNDAFLDNKVIKWRNVIAEIQGLSSLKKVCLTRKSFSDVPNIKKHVAEVEIYCLTMNIPFTYLSTPSRFYNQEKQDEWRRFLLS